MNAIRQMYLYDIGFNLYKIIFNCLDSTLMKIFTFISLFLFQKWVTIACCISIIINYVLGYIIGHYIRPIQIPTNTENIDRFILEQSQYCYNLMNTSLNPIIITFNSEGEIYVEEDFRRPLEKEKIKKLKLYTLTNNDLELEKYKSTCHICLDGYKINQTIKKLNCNHFFHSKCIDEWFEYGKTCPYCKKEV